MKKIERNAEAEKSLEKTCKNTLLSTTIQFTILHSYSMHTLFVTEMITLHSLTAPLLPFCNPSSSYIPPLSICLPSSASILRHHHPFITTYPFVLLPSLLIYPLFRPKQRLCSSYSTQTIYPSRSTTRKPHIPHHIQL